VHGITYAHNRRELFVLDEQLDFASGQAYLRILGYDVTSGTSIVKCKLDKESHHTRFALAPNDEQHLALVMYDDEAGVVTVWRILPQAEELSFEGLYEI